VLKVGIDSISFYTSGYALDLECLAKARGVDPDKYHLGLGQQKMSVTPPDEDVVTMAANAAWRAIQGIDINTIEMVLFATESGIDQSKAAGIYVHDLLGLPERCRVIELKQACYGATFGLQLALPFLEKYPDKKILLIASDIARYGLNTPAESSQGCGAVAAVLSANPRILALDSESGIATTNIMDFWRPNYSDAAFVDGKSSSRLYLHMLEKTWQQYHALSGRGFSDHHHYCYHTPVPRLVEKAHQYLAKLNGMGELSKDVMHEHIHHALEYGRKIGNSYTASLLIGLASLLDLNPSDLSQRKIGFYSYGSGCVAEYFSGTVQPDYKPALDSAYHQQMLDGRQMLTYGEYEDFYNFSYPTDGSSCDMPRYTKGNEYAGNGCAGKGQTGNRHAGKFRLAGFADHKRIYETIR